jgi:DNA gyrase/topoisomerase IV subunit A
MKFFFNLIQTLSEKGYIKRMAAGTFTAQNRGTTGKSGGKMRTNDAMSDFFVCHTHDYVLFFRYTLSTFMSLIKSGACLVRTYCPCLE